jgi:hypothetical protein
MDNAIDWGAEGRVAVNHDFRLGGVVRDQPGKCPHDRHVCPRCGHGIKDWHAQWRTVDVVSIYRDERIGVAGAIVLVTRENHRLIVEKRALEDIECGTMFRGLWDLLIRAKDGEEIVVDLRPHVAFDPAVRDAATGASVGTVQRVGDRLMVTVAGDHGETAPRLTEKTRNNLLDSLFAEQVPPAQRLATGFRASWAAELSAGQIAAIDAAMTGDLSGPASPPVASESFRSRMRDAGVECMKRSGLAEFSVTDAGDKLKLSHMEDGKEYALCVMWSALLNRERPTMLVEGTVVDLVAAKAARAKDRAAALAKSVGGNHPKGQVEAMDKSLSRSRSIGLMTEGLKAAGLHEVAVHNEAVDMLMTWAVAGQKFNHRVPWAMIQEQWGTDGRACIGERVDSIRKSIALATEEARRAQQSEPRYALSELVQCTSRHNAVSVDCRCIKVKGHMDAHQDAMGAKWQDAICFDRNANGAKKQITQCESHNNGRRCQQNNGHDGAHQTGGFGPRAVKWANLPAVNSPMLPHIATGVELEVIGGQLGVKRYPLAPLAALATAVRLPVLLDELRRQWREVNPHGTVTWEYRARSTPWVEVWLNLGGVTADSRSLYGDEAAEEIVEICESAAREIGAALLGCYVPPTKPAPQPKRPGTGEAWGCGNAGGWRKL